MSKIEWTDRTWNPIRGCTRVSPGCGGPGPYGGCYAERVAARFSGPGQPYEGIAEMRGGKPRWTGTLSFVESKLAEPLTVRKPTMWFVNSMSDLFHESVPDAWIDRVFAVMALCPQHTFQVLTKRAARLRAYLTTPHSPGKFINISDDGTRSDMAGAEVRVHNAMCALFNSAPPRALNDACAFQDRHYPGGEGFIRRWPLPNVWLGVSAEDQIRANERIPDLLATPAAIRFVSAEPLLGQILFEEAWHGEGALDSECWGECAWCEKGYPALHNCQRGLGDWKRHRSGLDWVIVGGESGPGSRPMRPEWVRLARDECAAAGVPFFFKQWGHFAPDDPAANRTAMRAVGKKAAGRLLDGIEHSAFPQRAHV